MPRQDYRFPGATRFVGEVADEQGDAQLSADVMRLPPVARAMGFLGNVPETDSEESRAELLKMAYREARTLQAGITAIQKGIEEVTDSLGVQAPYPQRGIPGALRPQPRLARESGRPTIGQINTAPVDSNELGGYASARPQGWGEAPPLDQSEDLDMMGIDEGMSGGPPRPDTGVNQSYNQKNIPTQQDVAPQGEGGKYAQDENPPHTEPNESDLGVGTLIRQDAPEAGSGLTPEASEAESQLAATPGPEASDEEKRDAERAAEKAGNPVNLGPEASEGEKKAEDMAGARSPVRPRPRNTR